MMTAILLAVSLLHVAPARAQATRTWVSGVGDDANPCSRTAPCKTFAGAISKTAAGGEINCIDPGGFGALTITKSITIVCDNTETGVLVSGTNGINIAAGATDVVTLRGLDIDGNGTGLAGINVTTVGFLHVQKSLIRNFRGPASGFGIRFVPTNAASQLSVSDTTLSENSAGILIQPSGTGSASVVLYRVGLEHNGNGLSVDGTNSTGTPISVTLRDVVAAGNSITGIVANTTSGKAITRVIIDRGVVVNNVTGISSQGTADILFGNTTIHGNGTGITFATNATLRSYGTNENNANVNVNGTPSTTATLQ